jgi:ABC-2 type transport system ATP-binding protein
MRAARLRAITGEGALVSARDASAGSDMALVEAHGLSRSYGDVAAVDALSFTVKRGEVVGFLGHNGAGKSTTMRMLAGALLPTGGRATIDGYAAASLEGRRRVGYLPETPPLTPELTVVEQLSFAARLRGAREDDVERVLALCDLGAERRRITATLSKGTRQRVGLAQALLGDPPALLLDEPTAGLDPRQAAAFRDLVRALAPDRAILISTHVLSEVTALCARVLLIRRGALVLDQQLEALRAEGRSLEETTLRALDGTLDGSAA